MFSIKKTSQQKNIFKNVFNFLHWKLVIIYYIIYVLLCTIFQGKSPSFALFLCVVLNLRTSNFFNVI